MKENEILAKMLDWIYAHTEARNQADVSRASGVDEVTISRVLNGKVKKVKQATLRKINTAFGSVFNPEWMRGASSVMLAADSLPADPSAMTAGSSDAPPSAPDMSSLINAALAAKDEAIASLKREIAAKDGVIATLHEQLRERADLMHSVRQQAADISGKYDALLQEHNNLLHRISVNIDTVNGSYIGIAAEAPADLKKK